MDNKGSEHKALIAEHGLSFYVEYDDFRFLFDCGAGPHFRENARHLGINLKNLDAVILSHSHYDHATGFRYLAENAEGSEKLYTGPHFFEPKYAFNGLFYTDLSAGFTEKFLSKRNIRHIVADGMEKVRDGIWLVSGFPRIFDFETIPSRFVRKTDNGFLQDDFADELCAVIRVKGGLVVLVGCSHPGILNMVTHIANTFSEPILAVYGGTHLAEAGEERIVATIRKLREIGVQVIGFSHCSGEEAEKYIRSRPDIKGCHLSTGDTVFYD